jgi:hypothetical protein
MSMSQVKTKKPGQGRPIYKHWGLWAAVGGAVVLGSIVAVAATRGGGEACGGACEPVTFSK